MKFLLVASLAMFSLNSFAQGDLAMKKEMMTKHIDQKIQRLQEAKTCISGSDTMDKVMQCKKQMKEHMKKMREEKKKKWGNKKK